MTRFCLMLLAAALVACAATPEDAVPVGDTSRNALDWPGVYVGTLPCADCEGIRTRVELRGNGTFTRSLIYLGKDVRPAEDRGTFTWDSSGSRVMLGADLREAQQYQVGENVLFPLDRDGQRITGDLAAAYRLEKTVNDPLVENTRWRLVELNGRAIQQTSSRESPYFELDASQARVTGNAWCNRFFGTYELTAGNRVRFGPNIGSTMRACPDLEREREFLDMLARVDNYSIGDGTLSLNRARMAPLARFRSAEAER